MPTVPVRKRFRLRELARNTMLLMSAFAMLLLLPVSHRFAVAAERAETSGVQLIMIEDPGCPYCARWHEEVGIAYAASAEGRFAPLVRRFRNHPDLANFKNVIYSPTFIVARNGVEIGRIVGYPGPDFFWGLLAKILERTGFSAQTGGS